jgi:hypothetical protein
MMRKTLSWILAGALALAPAPVLAAGAGNFTLVNATGSAISSMAIRRLGTAAWRPLAASPAAGDRQAVNFSDPDCAFDLKANLAGGVSATWTGVNLCEVKVVILNRAASGTTWVDYE